MLANYLGVLTFKFQAQNNIDAAGLDYDTEEDDEQWSPTCLDLGGVQLPTSRRHSEEKYPSFLPPVLPSRKKRSLEFQLAEDNESESDNGIAGHWDDLESRTAKRKPRVHLSPESAAQVNQELRCFLNYTFNFSAVKKFYILYEETKFNLKIVKNCTSKPKKNHYVLKNKALN